MMGTRHQALELFNAKWPNVQKVVDFHASKLGLRPADLDDLMQYAALRLWSHCRAAAGSAKRLNCQVIGLDAWAHFKRRDRRDGKRLRGRTVGRLERPDNQPGRNPSIDPPARAVQIRVDGCTFNLTDAAIDEPELYDLAAAGIGRAEAAAILGLGKERVRQLAPDLNGRNLPGIGWRYPRQAIETEARRRRSHLHPLPALE